jgi:hypothetical protein
VARSLTFRDVLIVVLLAVVFAPMAVVGLVDGDEGIYVYAARAVMDGKLLYHDFHFPQMPVVPYLYGVSMRVFGGWYGARMVSVVFALVLGWLVYRHVVRETGRPWAGTMAVVLLAGNALAFYWYPLVKTYALGTLLLFAAYTILESRLGRWKSPLAGLLLGLAIAVRLYLVVLIPIFAIATWRRGKGRAHQMMQVAGLAVGLVVAALPVEYLALIDVDTFAFNVLGVHGIRSEGGYVGSIGQKAAVVLSMLGVTGADLAAGAQFALLALACLVGLVTTLAARERCPLSSVIALAVLVVGLVPNPTYSQYFCMLLPFMVVDVARLAARTAAELEGVDLARRRLAGAMLTVLAVYLALGAIEVRRYTLAGEVVPGFGVAVARANWTVEAVREVGQAIEDIVGPGPHEVVSLWPGYLAESRLSIAPGLENPFAPWEALRLTPEQQVRYRLMPWPALFARLESGTEPVVVVPRWFPPGAAGTELRTFLQAHRYRIARTVRDADLYVPAAPGVTQ